MWQLSQVSHTVILTGCEDEDVMAASLRAGARGFLLKSDPISVVTEAPSSGLRARRPTRSRVAGLSPGRAGAAR
jgi:DNA-binding NarL/FixJ family response regulator